ncbi:hypothetical protein NPIL_157941 [Nephila pilipes]|uniref:Uncharacterized protein n=1 Tax=Nephila pilipes TaxID=299642 RepID=A0A8X6QHN4_NEPPI|nr:hypothetical protein NPIL_157941 [Nephila pilipes]
MAFSRDETSRYDPNYIPTSNWLWGRILRINRSPERINVPPERVFALIRGPERGVVVEALSSDLLLSEFNEQIFCLLVGTRSPNDIYSNSSCEN